MHVFCSLFRLSLKFEATCRLHPFHNIIMNISVLEILKLSDLCNLSTWSHNKENQKESHPNGLHDQCHLIDMQEESLLFLFHLVHCQSVVLHHSWTIFLLRIQDDKLRKSLVAWLDSAIPGQLYPFSAVSWVPCICHTMKQCLHKSEQQWLHTLQHLRPCMVHFRTLMYKLYLV